MHVVFGWSYLFFQWGQTGWHFLQHHRRHLLPDESEKTCAVLWERCVRQFSPVSQRTSPLKNTARLAHICFICQKWHTVHQKHSCYTLCSILNYWTIVCWTNKKYTMLEYYQLIKQRNLLTVTLILDRQVFNRMGSARSHHKTITVRHSQSKQIYYWKMSGRWTRKNYKF